MFYKTHCKRTSQPHCTVVFPSDNIFANTLIVFIQTLNYSLCFFILIFRTFIRRVIVFDRRVLSIFRTLHKFTLILNHAVCDLFFNVHLYKIRLLYATKDSWLSLGFCVNQLTGDFLHLIYIKRQDNELVNKYYKRWLQARW